MRPFAPTTQVVIILLLAALILIVGLQLAGVVGGNPDPQLVALEEQVSALEERLASLQEASGTGDAPVGQTPPASNSPSPSPSPAKPSADQRPEPTVDPTTAAKLSRGQINLVDLFTGVGAFQSRVFTMDSSPWVIIWNLSGDDPDTMLKVLVYRVDSDSPLELAVDASEAGNSAAYIFESGAFFLEIEASGSWNILVADIQ